MEDNKLQIIDTEAEEVSLSKGETSLAAFDHRQKLLSHALELGVRATSFGDWQDYGGKPYLQGSGAEKMLPKLPGFKIRNVSRTREDHEDKKGPYYVYIVSGTATFYTSEIEVFGQCSSRYHVSAKRGSSPNLPMEDINITDVMADAYSDMVRNAVTRLFGLRNLEWEDLGKYGITKGTRSSLRSGKPPAPSQQGGDLEKRKKKMFAVLCEYFTKNPHEGQDPPQAASNFIYEIIGVPYNKVATINEIEQVGTALKGLKESDL